MSHSQQQIYTHAHEHVNNRSFFAAKSIQPG